MNEHDGPNLGVLSERIKNLDATVTRLEKRLFGNGAPGEIEKTNVRLTAIEKLVWRIQGIGMIVMIAVELASKFWRR